MRRLLRALPFVICAACGGADGAKFSDGVPSAADATGGTPTEPVDTVDTAVTEVQPAWYALDAQLRILAGGDLDPAASIVQVSLWSDALERLCTHDVPLLSVTPEPLPDGEPVTLAWWRLSLGDGVPDEPGCGPWPARAVRFGLGTYDPRLDPAVAQHGWDGATLLGFYLEPFEASGLLVVGIAGTAGMFAGDEVPATEPPLPEGRYDARTLLLLPL